MSLCLIVKDEEDNLERCLASVRGIADEIVVYDTGSSDGTVTLARDLGARVVEGEWHDDFGRARNEALAHCTGNWILHLDADEELVFEPGAVQRGLERAAGIDVLLLPIRNVGARGGEYAHYNRRLFRRQRAQWTGRLHERVVSRDGRSLREANLLGGEIVHHGYAEEIVAERGKSARNIRIAHAELEQAGPGDDHGALMVNVSRSYGSAGDKAMALEWIRRARRVARTDVRTTILRIGAELLTDQQHFDEARQWTDELAENGADPHMVAYLRGSADLLDGRPAPELAELAELDELMGEDGMGVPVRQLRLRTAMALASCQRWDEAATALLDVVHDDPEATVWGLLATCVHQSGSLPDEAVAAIPDGRLRQVLAQILLEPVDTAQHLGPSLADRFGDDPRFVGFAVHHARRLADLEAMLPWSTIVRNGHLEEHCPVIERAGDPTVEPAERFMAAVVAHAAFRDARAAELLDSITDLLTPEDEPGAIHVLTELAPDLVVSGS